MKYRRTRKHWKYEVREEYSCPLLPCMKEAEGKVDKYVELKDGCITIHPGYRWNGADWFPDFECTQEATLVHDALYQLMDEGGIATSFRKCADRQLYCMVKNSRSCRFASALASAMYNAVRGYQGTGWPVRMPAGALGGLWGAIKGSTIGEKFRCDAREEACPEAQQDTRPA